MTTIWEKELEQYRQLLRKYRSEFGLAEQVVTTERPTDEFDITSERAALAQVKSEQADLDIERWVKEEMGKADRYRQRVERYSSSGKAIPGRSQADDLAELVGEDRKYTK